MLPSTVGPSVDCRSKAPDLEFSRMCNAQWQILMSWLVVWRRPSTKRGCGGSCYVDVQWMCRRHCPQSQGHPQSRACQQPARPRFVIAGILDHLVFPWVPARRVHSSSSALCLVLPEIGSELQMPTRSGPGQRGHLRGQSAGVCPGVISPRPARKLTAMLGGGARLPDDGTADPRNEISKQAT